MSVFIIGGDNLGKINENMEKIGHQVIMHVAGRKNSTCRNFQIPGDTDLVLVLTDFVNHNLMKKVKKEAEKSEIEIIFAKRSWSSIYTKLKKNDRVRCN